MYLYLHLMFIFSTSSIHILSSINSILFYILLFISTPHIQDFLFIMSGKRTPTYDLATPLAAPSASTSEQTSPLPSPTTTVEEPVDEEVEKEEVYIPTVMLTKTDAHELSYLISTLTHAQKHDQNHARNPKNKRPYVRIQSTSLPTLFDSVFMGYYEYPKIRVAEGYISVISKREWGVILTKAHAG